MCRIDMSTLTEALREALHVIEMATGERPRVSQPYFRERCEVAAGGIRAALAAHEAGQAKPVAWRFVVKGSGATAGWEDAKENPPPSADEYPAYHIELAYSNQPDAYRQAALDCAAACEHNASRGPTHEHIIMARACADACRAIAERGAKERDNLLAAYQFEQGNSNG